MTALAISGWGVLSAGGIGPEALAARLRGERPGGRLDGPDPVPSPAPAAVPDFDVRALLGRKGTSTLDRCTALSIVACGLALEDGGLRVDDGTRADVGIAFGTTVGSLKSTMDFSRETLVNDRPYLVNALLFPNTVMNCAAGQAAIRYGLRGVNATVAGGPLAFLHVLRYAGNVLRRGYADVLLAGAAEELTAQTAWSARLAEPAGGTVPAGEGAAVFVVRTAAAGRAAGRPADAEVLAVRTGHAPDGDVSAALTGCVRAALDAAGSDAADVALVATAEAGDDRLETAAVTGALGREPAEVLRVKETLGECQAATGALQVAAVLTRHDGDPSRDGQVSLVTGRTRDGGVAAAVLRGWSRAAAGR